MNLASTMLNRAFHFLNLNILPPCSLGFVYRVLRFSECGFTMVFGKVLKIAYKRPPVTNLDNAVGSST